MKRKPESTISESSGNIFSDLGFRDGEELQTKSALVFRISKILQEKALNQTEAAKLLGIDQPKVSNLLRGKIDGFSIDRLFRLLNALNQEVEIVIKPKRQSKKKAEIKVLAA